MNYRLDDLAKELGKLDPGYGVAIDLPIFRRLFPPGETDKAACQKAETFADRNDCAVIFGAYKGAVYFRRKKPNEIPL